MVFCYKLITDSPRRSYTTSPAKGSPTRQLPVLPSSISQLVNSVDYDDYAVDVLDSVPERDWRLLAALAKKREEDDERDKIARELRKLWLKEKEERDMLTAQSSEQYKRYLLEKRRKEHLWLEAKRQEKGVDEQLRRGQLVDYIKYKDRKSADILAWNNDKKACDVIAKAIQDEAKILMAADRRTRLGAVEEWRKRIKTIDALRKVNDARRRRAAFLRDNSQRLAIASALNTWETALLRQEVAEMEQARRAQHAARASLAAARGDQLAHARRSKQAHARRVAAFTAQLRDAVRK